MVINKKITSSIQSLLGIFGYHIVSTKSDNIINMELGEIYTKCKPFTMTSAERMYALYKATEYVVKAKIPGDFVECGVWKGGSAMIIAYALLQKKETSRKIYLYDTYEGMPKPTTKDKRLLDNTFAISNWRANQKKRHNEWCFASLSEVKRNLLSTGYPEENLVFVRGRVENTIPKITPKKIALLRLDTDWYESTRHELRYLFPLLQKNGVLIIDDYGCWAGAKKAVDDYFKKRNILLNRIDYTGRIGIKIDTAKR